MFSSPAKRARGFEEGAPSEAQIGDSYYDPDEKVTYTWTGTDWESNCVYAESSASSTHAATADFATQAGYSNSTNGFNTVAVTSPVVGSIYYNTHADAVFVYTGSKYSVVGNADVTITISGVTGGETHWPSIKEGFHPALLGPYSVTGNNNYFPRNASLAEKDTGWLNVTNSSTVFLPPVLPLEMDISIQSSANWAQASEIPLEIQIDFGIGLVDAVTGLIVPTTSITEIASWHDTIDSCQEKDIYNFNLAGTVSSASIIAPSTGQGYGLFLSYSVFEKDTPINDDYYFNVSAYSNSTYVRFMV